MDQDEPFEGWTAVEAIEACFGAPDAETAETLLASLRKGRLVGLTRRRDRNGVLEYLPAAGWKTVNFSSVDESVAEEVGTGVPHHDVRIFPVLKSPNVIDLLDGKSVRLIFHRYIIGDPQVWFLGVKALEVDPNVAFLLNSGMHAETHFEWPLYVKWEEPDEVFDEPGAEFIWNDDPEPKPPEIEVLYSVIEDRFTSLTSLLADRKLEGHGDPVRVGDGSLILSSIWSGGGYAFHSREGEILRREETEDPDDRRLYYYVPRWRAVAVFRPLSRVPYFLPFSADAIPQHGRPTDGARDSVSTTVPAETACLDWLVEEMQKSLYDRPRPKAAFQAAAAQNWPGRLSKRAFDRCWQRAVERTNSMWNVAGAPRRRQL